jgi:hypothetical protein
MLYDMGYGLPLPALHMAVHGFVFWKLQNRTMSTICKLPGPLRKPAVCTQETLKVLQLLITAGISNLLVTVFAERRQDRLLCHKTYYPLIKFNLLPRPRLKQPHATAQIPRHTREEVVMQTAHTRGPLAFMLGRIWKTIYQ